MLTALHKFANLDHSARSMLLRAFFVVAAVRAALWVLPFHTVRKLVARFSKKSAGTNSAGKALVPLHLVIYFVERAARKIPAATCLTQALATKILLSRAGYDAIVRLGAQSTGKQLKAHAWVECANRIVIGNVADLSGFTVLPDCL